MNEKKKETEEFVKPIFLTDPDTGDKYELDFNKESVHFAEEREFKISDVTEYPSTCIPKLFYYSFRMHHRKLSKQQTDAILEKLGGVTPVFTQRLIELYYQAGYVGVITTEEDQLKNSKLIVEM